VRQESYVDSTEDEMGEDELAQELELARRAASYRTLFGSPVAERVLDDLAYFCHANSTVHVIGDPYGTAQLEGRRQVWLRIQHHLGFDPARIVRVIEPNKEETP